MRYGLASQSPSLKMWKVILFVAAASAAQALPQNPSVSASNFLQGAEEATPGQFPYQVGIWVTPNERGSQQTFCGGAILSEHIVITTANCAQPGLNFTVVVGAHDIRKDGTKYVTSKKLVQESYQAGWQNDIALLYIEEAIEFNDLVQPIRLPAPAADDEDDKSFENAKVILSGWGSENIAAASTLRFSRSHVISNELCFYLYFSQKISDSNICASGLWGRAACKLDDGGPMITYEDDGKPTLLGIKTFTTALGCKAVFPVSFTRISPYLRWIADSSKALSG